MHGGRAAIADVLHLNAEILIHRFTHDMTDRPDAAGTGVDRVLLCLDPGDELSEFFAGT